MSAIDDLKNLELKFALLWDSLFPEIDLFLEQRIIPGRNFRFDFTNLDAKVCIEINGQIWTVGGHSSGKGLLRDYEKLNLAQSHGYIVFQLSREMITRDWLKLIAKTIQSRLN